MWLARVLFLSPRSILLGMHTFDSISDVIRVSHRPLSELTQKKEKKKKEALSSLPFHVTHVTCSSCMFGYVNMLSHDPLCLFHWFIVTFVWFHWFIVSFNKINKQCPCSVLAGWIHFFFGWDLKRKIIRSPLWTVLLTSNLVGHLRITNQSRSRIDCRFKLLANWI